MNPTHQPRVNENQERLMEEEYAIVCISSLELDGAKKS
jgi:hypothetical protein